MKKSMRKPENWQDFESLCKMLWGEIWGCKEIKKNGRNGQAQNGVDIYGVPSRESQYYGIQCKGKDDYTESPLTKNEIDNEIQKAVKFKPPLKKLYFATTANKDTNIEEYVRIIDQSNREKGLFEVHLFCWEDIVDLIETNKATYDWYVKNINHKIQYGIKVSFHTKEEKILFSPLLLKNHVTYQTENIDYLKFGIGFPPANRHEKKREIETEPQPRRFFMDGMTENKSSCVFSLRLENTGNSAIKNFKLYFRFVSEGILVDRVSKKNWFLDDAKYSYDIFIDTEDMSGLFEPNESVLVQKDSLYSDDLCLRPTKEENQIVHLEWELVSEDFNDEGRLEISITPEITEQEIIEKVDQYTFKTDEVRLDNYRI